MMSPAALIDGEPVKWLYGPDVFSIVVVTPEFQRETASDPIITTEPASLISELAPAPPGKAKVVVVPSPTYKLSGPPLKALNDTLSEPLIAGIPRSYVKFPVNVPLMLVNTPPAPRKTD